MGIFSRTRDIIAANMSDLLDRADDPAKTIRMIINEMEDTLVEVRATAARHIADQKELRRHVTRLRQLEANWEEKAELALSKGREDLAKAALAERHKATETARELEAEISNLEGALAGYDADIAKLQGKLADARKRQNAINARMESAQLRTRARSAWGGERAEEAFARFEALERRADLAEGQADALALGRPPSLDDQLSALRSSDQVDEALEALKARVAKREG